MNKIFLFGILFVLVLSGVVYVNHNKLFLNKDSAVSISVEPATTIKTANGGIIHIEKTADGIVANGCGDVPSSVYVKDSSNNEKEIKVTLIKSGECD